jgi:hypothetical protein
MLGRGLGFEVWGSVRVPGNCAVTDFTTECLKNRSSHITNNNRSELWTSADHVVKNPQLVYHLVSQIIIVHSSPFCGMPSPRLGPKFYASSCVWYKVLWDRLDDNYINEQFNTNIPALFTLAKASLHVSTFTESSSGKSTEYVNLFTELGLAIAQAVCRWLLTAAARVRIRV